MVTFFTFSICFRFTKTEVFFGTKACVPRHEAVQLWTNHFTPAQCILVGPGRVYSLEV